MKNILKIIFLIIMCFTTTQVSALYGNYDEFIKDVTPKEKNDLIIPQGSYFRVITGEDVSSEFNNNGDIVKFLITSDFISGNEIIVPKNSLFYGRVVGLEKAQQGRDGYFSINIIGLVLPDNRQFNAKGYVSAGKNNREFGGAFARRSGYKTTVHRSACFKRIGVMQLRQNGPRIMGEETLIRTGTILTIVLEEPINLSK